MRIACLIAAGLLLAAPALAAERPHNAKYSRAADPIPRFSAPVRHAVRAVRTRPVARRLGGYGYGYREAQLIGRVRGPRPLIPTGYEVPGGTFYMANSGGTSAASRSTTIARPRCPRSSGTASSARAAVLARKVLAIYLKRVGRPTHRRLVAPRAD